MMLGNKNHAYLGERMQRVVGLDRVQRVAQYLKGLICTPTKLHRLYDSSDMYELQFQSLSTMDVQKKYLPCSSGTAHASVVRCLAVSFHRTRRQSHCRHWSQVAGLCRPQCRPV
jgi:hypothetical protein